MSGEGLALHKCWLRWWSPDQADPLFLLPLVPPRSAWLLVATQEHDMLLPYLQSLLFLALQSEASSSRTVVRPVKDSE